MKEEILLSMEAFQQMMQRAAHEHVFTSLPALGNKARSLLDTEEIDLGDREFLMKHAVPALAGIAIGASVFVAFLLFFLVSACCKCCNSDRGCCQRPQHKTYKQRLPYVAIIAAVAILGAIGGIIVLSAGPKTVGVVDAFIADVVELVRDCSNCSVKPNYNGCAYVVVYSDGGMFPVQLDSLLDTLRSIVQDTGEALAKANVVNGAVDELQEAMDELDTLREEDVQNTLDAADKVLKLISTIAMAIGGVLMGVALLGLCGAALLQSWMLSSFLLLAFLLNWCAWILFGAFTFTGGVLTEVCMAIDEVLAGQASRLPEMDCTEIATAGYEATSEIQGGIVEAITAANTQIADANEAGVEVIDIMNSTCSSFNSGGSIYNSLCVSTPPSVDAALLSSIYQCVSPSLLNIATFNINDALDNPASCSWHQANYPTHNVDFGTNDTGNCFATATSLLNDPPTYRGVVAAASRDSVGSLLDEGFVRNLTSTIRLGCAYDAGLCSPYQAMGDVYVPTPPATCTSMNLTLMEDVETVYGAFTCTGIAPANENRASRETCVVMGTPLFPSELTDMKGKAEAVVIFQSVIERLQQFVSCSFLLDMLAVWGTHCHPLADSIKLLGTGCLLAALGMTLTSLMICSCWRKVTKPADGQVAPADNKF